jgi:hypothetical protein
MQKYKKLQYYPKNCDNSQAFGTKCKNLGQNARIWDKGLCYYDDYLASMPHIIFSRRALK